MALVPGSSFATTAKSDICHINGQGLFKLINISNRAYDKHLNHGDQPTGAFYPDNDGDTFGDPSGVVTCPGPGLVIDNTDCNDMDGEINPGATEILGNGIDDDCDEGTPDDPGLLCPCQGKAAGGITWSDAFEVETCTVDSSFVTVFDSSGRSLLTAYLPNPFGLPGSCRVGESEENRYPITLEEYAACQSSLISIAQNDEIACDP